MKKRIEIKPHARKQLQERQIEEDAVRELVRYPGQILDSYKNRKVAQDIIEYNKEQFLIRVIYEEMKDHIEVVTVYLTKKIQKYWEG